MVKVELSREELRLLVSIMHNRVLGTKTEGRKLPSYQRNCDLLEKLSASLIESNSSASSGRR